MLDIKSKSFGSLPRTFYVFSKKCSSFCLSSIGFLLIFLLACGVVLTENEVIGAAIFIVIISVALIICDDILATTLPFLLLCVFVTRCYDSFKTFIKFAPLAIIVVFGIVFHFIVFKQRRSVGNTFTGLIAVSIAFLFGGLGFISLENYFKGSSIYHTIFLGIGMAIFYLLFKSQLTMPRKYDVKKKLISILYIMGLLACVVILYFIVCNLSIIKEQKAIPYLQASNNLSTILLFALPMPFFFISNNPLHIISPFLMYGCIILSGSRSGILLGALLLILSIIASACWDKKLRILYIALLIIILVVFIAFGNIVLKFSMSSDFKEILFFNDARFTLLKRGFAIFPRCPIFGHGLGYTGNTDIYSPVKGAMEWYHMMIPQIVASLGIVGIMAYGYQFYLRIKTAVKAIKSEKGRKRGAVVTLIMSYVGVLLMSQVNPGLFCPLPYSLMAVMIFAVLDGEIDHNFIVPIKKR